MLLYFGSLLLLAALARTLQLLPVDNEPDASVQTRQDAEAVAPMVNFQVSQPLVLPKDAKQCTYVLIHHLFADSYYKPAIVDLTPPTDCGAPGSWAGVSLNWTATSNGTQYDRLSGVTLSNVEIWRTSTAEPTADGIIWTVLKDVTRFIPLFAKPGRMILDLNNIISDTRKGEFDVTLSVTYYQSSARHPPAKTADVIVPLSNLRNDDSNMLSVPPIQNVSVALPRNTIQAFAEIQASGNSMEEFWYYNVPDKYLPSLPADTTYGKGPFREVRVLVDNRLAGVVFPYAVLFTGAMVPPIWRPIPAYGAFDLPTYNVDLTPFVPLLADGANHIVSLEVVSSEDDHSINGNWYLSGNIQVVLDESSKPTTGRITAYSVEPYAVTTVDGSVSEDGTQLDVSVTAKRTLEIRAQLVSGSGKRKNVVWKQHLEFSNKQSYLNSANRQIVNQFAKGSSISTHNAIPVISDTLSFPISIDFWFTGDDTGTGWSSIFDHTYNRNLLPNSLQLLTDIKTRQTGNGTYIYYPNEGYARHANGSTTNEFAYWDAKGNTYTRSVAATNAQILYDREGGSLSWNWPAWTKVPASRVDSYSNGVGRLPGGRNGQSGGQ